MIRLLIFLVLAGALAYCGATVKLGNKTFFEHVRAIWHTEQVQDLKNGVEDTAGPAVHKVERGISAGVRAMKNDESGSGSGALIDAGTAPDHAPAPVHAPASP